MLHYRQLVFFILYLRVHAGLTAAAAAFVVLLAGLEAEFSGREGFGVHRGVSVGGLK